MDLYEKLKRQVLAALDWSPAEGMWRTRQWNPWSFQGLGLGKNRWRMLVVVKIKDGWVYAEKLYWTRSHYRLGKLIKAIAHRRREFYMVKDWQFAASKGLLKKATALQVAAWKAKMADAQAYQPKFRPSIYDDS